MPLPLAQPPSRRGAGGREADAVLARVGGAKREFAGVGPFGADDAVVVVEDFVDGDGDGEVRVRGEGAVLGFQGAVVAYKVISLDDYRRMMLREGVRSPTTKVSLGSSS